MDTHKNAAQSSEESTLVNHTWEGAIPSFARISTEKKASIWSVEYGLINTMKNKIAEAFT